MIIRLVWSDKDTTIKSHKASSMLVKVQPKVCDCMFLTYHQLTLCLLLLGFLSRRTFIIKHFTSIFGLFSRFKNCDISLTEVNIETNKIHKSIDITIQIISMNINYILVCIWLYGDETLVSYIRNVSIQQTSTFRNRQAEIGDQ